MVNIEMQYEFTKLIQEMDESFESIKRPTSETIFRMLNYAIDRYIKEKYLSGPTMKQNVQEIQYRSDDLRNLIVRDKPLPMTTPGSTVYDASRFALPSDYMFYMRSDSQILKVYPGANDPSLPDFDIPEWTPNRVADYSEIDKIVTTPTNKPILRKPVAIFETEDVLSIFVDRYTTLYACILTYLRKPKLLVLDKRYDDLETTECELAAHTHEEIVKLAVDMYIDKYKTHLTTTAQ